MGTVNAGYNCLLQSMSQLQQLEEERLKELHKYLTLYKQALDSVSPQMTTVGNWRRFEPSASMIARLLNSVFDITDSTGI